MLAKPGIEKRLNRERRGLWDTEKREAEEEGGGGGGGEKVKEEGKERFRHFVLEE